MSNKAVQSMDDSEEDAQALQMRITTLEMELEQKNVLLEQGFSAFTEAAEKLRESHKRLQIQVAELNLELEEKNRELERNLEEREKVKTYLSNIFESLPVGVFVTDLLGSITSVNMAGLEMVGQAADELVGQGINEMLGEELLDPYADGEEGQEEEWSLSFERPDGELLKLNLSLTPMSGEGQVLGYILNVQDVTRLRQLEEQAQRRDRFTAMGEMAANIAHEIRNPLGSIELFASLVKKGMAEEDEHMVMMNHISSGITNMNHVISNVLEYTKPRPANLKRMNLHQVLEEVLGFSRYMAEQNGVAFEEKLANGTPIIRGDVDQMRQVFQNMILNAVQAMTDGGRLHIFTKIKKSKEARKISAEQTETHGEQPNLGSVVVGFQDNGPGISPEVQSQIFDPFFTTKSRGTGLGLAIVHNIIESHEATIEVESKLGKGAEFTFMFPLVTER